MEDKDIKFDMEDPQGTYKMMVKYLDGITQKLVIKFSLSGLFDMTQDEIETLYEKTIDKVVQAVAYTAASITIFNKWEEYEYSKIVNDKARDIYVLVFSKVEPHTSIKEFEQEYDEFIRDIMEELEERINEH